MKTSNIKTSARTVVIAGRRVRITTQTATASGRTSPTSLRGSYEDLGPVKK